MKGFVKKTLAIYFTVAMFVVSIGLYLYPGRTYAAISHDTDSTKIVNGFAASPTNTWTHTTTAKATLGVLTCSLWQDVGGSGTVGSASLNSIAITAINSTRSGSMYSYIGYIVNPSSNAQTVSVTVSGNIDGFKCSFSTYFGTRSDASVVDTSSLGATGATPYTSVSTAIITNNTNELVVSTLSKFGTEALTVGGGGTTILNDVTGSIGGASSYQLVVLPSSVSPAWTMASNSNDWSMVDAAFNLAPPQGHKYLFNGKNKYLFQ